MKVGRFGLGFKSVFHMTDLPSLLSDKQIGFIDPHGVYFSDKRYSRTGKHWRLHEDRASMKEIPDQFFPYKGIFSCTDEVFSQGFYDGTLFRFPFRSEPSDLSEKLYYAGKMDTLFESFKADAPLILLFLQHLESIELYIREESKSNPRRIFQVKIAEKSLQTVRAKRKDFRENITPGKVMPASITVTYPITIETVDFESPLTDNTNKHSFLVTNYFCGGRVSSTFKRLMTDKELSYLPTVGVAMALPTGPKLETPTIKGHVFCFVPLPVQKTSLTGLPVHVNGFFALSQNRHYIKSPNADQEDREKAGRKLTDKSLLWNKCLLEEAIPRAYATMILEAIKEKSVFVSKEAVYKAWPDINSIAQKWKGLEKPLFELLLKKNVVHTQAEGGKWVAVEKALFQQDSGCEQHDLLLRVLLSVSLPAVTVPTHVLRAVDVYAPVKAGVTPTFVRRVLRQVPSCYTSLNKTEKLLLLQFSLSDRRFKDLDSLQLLPLANGTFARFDNRATTVYIASPEHPQELFPGVRDRFLDTEVDEDILGNLRAAVSQGHTQLRFLNRDHVPALLWHSLPPDWKIGDSVSWYPNVINHNHPPKDWIERVWGYLRHQFSTSEDIQRLGRLPLIPLSMYHTPVTLTRLSQPTRIVAKRFNDDCIDGTLTNVLKKVGVIVMSDFPTFISHHPAVLGNFVNPPTVQGVLKAMVISASTMGAGAFTGIVRSEVSTKEKQVLRSFLANVRPVYVGKEQFDLLCSIPIFETLSKTFVSKKDGLCAAPVEALPVPPLQDLIDVSQDDSRTLAILLNVRILKPTELLCEMIFPDIQQEKYTEGQIDRLMAYVLKRSTHVIYTNVSFKRNIQALPFVPTQRKRVKASDVYDPRNYTLQTIFALEDVFPVGELYNDSSVLLILEDLGMKSESSIDATDLLQSAKQVSMLPHLPIVRQKCNAILQHLSIHPQKLEKAIDGQQLGSLLMKIRWVPRLRQKTSNFPPSLPWWEEEEEADDEEVEVEDVDEEERYFFKPTDLKSHQVVNLIGTVKPVVDFEPSEEVSAYFGWQKDPDVFDVVKHLQNVVTCYTEEDKPYYMIMLNEIYSFLSRANHEAVSQAFQWAEIVDWVWNGNGFSSPNHVLFSKPPIDLTPYILPLPSEMIKHSHVFNRFGMRAESDPDLLLQVLGMIKEKYDHQTSQFETSDVGYDLQLSVNILNEVAQKELSAEIRGKILLPTHVKDNLYVRLELVEHCIMRDVTNLCYNDSAWMLDVRDEKLVHEKVPLSTCIQLGVKTRKEEDLQQHDAGFPFGQKEELTNRLKRILKGYPGEKEILKELLQNADDAQATEIWFIKDPRHHPDKKVFKESWKPLQGPALCVYNNRPFTNEDIEGLCNLGKGNKGEDPNKTGQYGVGFNAVYHLTDVPSFRSTGEEIGDVLCVFDPHCRYVPGANDANPGRMYKDIEILKTKFPDVFRCYLEEHFSMKNATMFRFPLKSEKMAEESKISLIPVTVEALDAMMKEMKKELFEVLLFVNNVKKISISEIGKRGKLVNTYCVEVAMSQEDDRERQAFADYMKEIGRQAKLEDFLPTSIKAKKCIYTMMLRDNFGKEDTWLIVQQVGFEKPPEKSIVKAFKDHQLGMLPRGGVAYLLESSRASSTMQRKSKAYCFLPLPFETNLPVHINGHFALDHEARRNLWRDEDGGYRSDWNNALLRDVIASCYLALLDKVRGFLQLPVEQDGAAHNSPFSRSAVLVGLNSYEQLFPRYRFEDPHWKTLVDSVYQEMNKKEMRLIPVLRRFEGSSSGRAKNSKESVRVQVTWFPPIGRGKKKTYFNNLEMKGCFAALLQRRDIPEEERKRKEEGRMKRRITFEETLLETGLNLVALSVTVFDSFREAGVEVCCVSPSAVVDFYKSFSDADPLCNIGVIPCRVDKTPFRNKKGVILVLKYCKDNDQFLENLPGLPLLLTQDNYLRVFSVNDPRCLSHYTDILPGSPSLFVHTEVHSEVFNNVDFKKAPTLRPLDVQIFSSRLHLTLPGCFRSEDHHMRWRPNDSASNLPNRRWIYRVWDFLQTFASETMEKSDVSEKKKNSFIRDLLSPLSEWSILPATETRHLESSHKTCSFTTVRDKQTVEDHVLAPLNMAESVVDFLDCGSPFQKLVEVLRKLGLPELNSFVITTVNIGEVPYTKKDSYEFARNLVSTTKTPHSLLMALKQKLKTNPSSLDGKVECSEAEDVLGYFSSNINALTDEDREALRKLPFFPLAGGGHGKTEDRNVFVLPDKIPQDGMDVVQSRLRCLFVESRERLLDLYSFLGFHQVSPADVYLRFVLKCLPHLSLETKLAHLGYLRVFILSTSVRAIESEELETEQLLDYLKIVEFIPSSDGSSKKASSFYDPRNDLFSTMLSDEKDSFPPNPFDSDEWLSFLEKIGLVTDVSQDDFLKFADQVAQEAETARTEKTYTKSEILVHHLISRRNVVDEGLLHRVCDIPFVAAQPVRKALQDLCPPFGGKKDDEISFVAFKGSVVSKYEKTVWTKAHLLPNWAVPTQFHPHDIGCRPHQDMGQYLDAFLAQLQVLKEPSIDLVVSHCQKICSHLGSSSERRNITDERCLTIIAVMKSIYTFLQEKAITDRNVKMILTTTRCILVEQGKTFILPSQAILDLYEDLEIKPFLYRVPPEFGEFQRFFEFLGCSKTATSRHYAMLLEKLQNNCQNANLDPDDVKTCSKAVKGFFDTLQEDTQAVSTLSKLYLPAMPSGHGLSNMSANIDTIPVTLNKSTELIFDDAPTYGNRIHGLQQLFVLHLSLMGVTCKSTMVNYKDLMMKLPLALQPKMLSFVVKEKLSNPENTVIVTSEAVNALKQRLSSVQFCRGIARIIRHANFQNKDFDEQVLLSIEREVRSIELFAVENLRTSLFHNGVLIPDSEAEVTYFKEKVEKSGVETWRVYVNSLTGMDVIILTLLVANIIVEIYGDFLGKEAYAIPSILSCHSLQISPLLDAIHLRQDDSYISWDIDICSKPFPQPEEAERWFRQAEADLVAGANEIAFNTNSYEWACYKCHQAAEKALKAVHYKEDANQKTNDHNLSSICCDFDDHELTELASQLEGLVVNSTRMRYPDKLPRPKIPNDAYTADDAEEALEIATKILEKVRNRFN